MMFKKWIGRYQKWKIWRQYTWMGPVRQLLVLFNLIECTWFDKFDPGQYKLIRPWNKSTDYIFRKGDNK